MRVCIAGSRSISNYRLLLDAIKESGFEISEIVCGGANGVDKLGEKYSKLNNIPIKYFHARWDDLLAKDAIIRKNAKGVYNANAGYDRNKLMADYSDALIAIWDGKSKGTKNMIDLAQNNNIKIYIKNV